MTARCRVCGLRLSGGKVRYQMTRRDPLECAPARLWWLCRLHYEEFNDALDTVRETYFGAKVEAVS